MSNDIETTSRSFAARASRSREHLLSVGIVCYVIMPPRSCIHAAKHVRARKRSVIDVRVMSTVNKCALVSDVRK